MAFLCHEIRNPLFAVTSSAQFLQDTKLTGEQEIGVASILDSSLLMLRLVNDVLDISKINAGKLELKERLYDLHALTGKLEGTLRIQVHQKHGDRVRFNLQVAPDVPRVIYGDSTRLLQIIYNLLSNANKFTDEGCIRLSIETTTEAPPVASNLQRERPLSTDAIEQESDGLLHDNPEEGIMELSNYATKVIRVIVQDTGTGISPERIKHIFKPYSQAKLSDYRKHGGTGLGLAIISSLIELMGETISVRSTVCVGSTFTLVMPLKVSLTQDFPMSNGVEENLCSDVFATTRRLPNTSIVDSASSAKSNDENPAGGSPPPTVLLLSSPDVTYEETTQSVLTSTTLSKAAATSETTESPTGTSTILIVDDNNVNRKVIARMLKYYNIDHRLAENGQIAVDIMNRSRNVTGNTDDVHIGLVFMDLQMPVMDGYEAMYAIRAKGLDVPMIALTANALSQEKERALEAGATDFLTKPIMREDLHAVCKKYLA